MACGTTNVGRPTQNIPNFLTSIKNKPTKQMKKISLLFVFNFILLSMVFAEKKTCSIHLTITDTTDGTVYIRDLNTMNIDTINFSKGEYTYTTKIAETTPFIIADERNNYQLFFGNSEDKVNIKLERKRMQVTFLDGSKSHELFRSLVIAQTPLQQQAQQLQQVAPRETPGFADSMNAEMTKINESLKANFFNFLKTNSSSAVAAFVVHSSISNDRNMRSTAADSMYAQLTGFAKTCHYGLETVKIIKKLKSVEVGTIAPDFTLADSTGKKKYTLSALRGKYVLLDFWASWCGPCKGEIPYMKSAYTAYHDKGFEIMSVSLDSKRDAWVDALNMYKMPWIHVSDLKGFNSLVNDLYLVPSIPKTLLLDKTGKIIATDLRGKELDKKLEEIFIK